MSSEAYEEDAMTQKVGEAARSPEVAERQKREEFMRDVKDASDEILGIVRQSFGLKKAEGGKLIDNPEFKSFHNTTHCQNIAAGVEDNMAHYFFSKQYYELENLEEELAKQNPPISLDEGLRQRGIEVTKLGNNYDSTRYLMAIMEQKYLAGQLTEEESEQYEFVCMAKLVAYGHDVVQDHEPIDFSNPAEVLRRKIHANELNSAKATYKVIERHAGLKGKITEEEVERMDICTVPAWEFGKDDETGRGHLKVYQPYLTEALTRLSAASEIENYADSVEVASKLRTRYVALAGINLAIGDLRESSGTTGSTYYLLEATEVFREERPGIAGFVERYGNLLEDYEAVQHYPAAVKEIFDWFEIQSSFVLNQQQLLEDVFKTLDGKTRVEGPALVTASYSAFLKEKYGNFKTNTAVTEAFYLDIKDEYVDLVAYVTALKMEEHYQNVGKGLDDNEDISKWMTFVRKLYPIVEEFPEGENTLTMFALEEGFSDLVTRYFEHFPSPKDSFDDRKKNAQALGTLLINLGFDKVNHQKYFEQDKLISQERVYNEAKNILKLVEVTPEPASA